MNKFRLILFGVLLTVIASLSGLVIIPSLQVGQLKPIQFANDQTAEETGQTVGEKVSCYPAPLTDVEKAGRRVYESLGCIYCHSQQVRPEHFGADLERGWGKRRSVARDYLTQQPPLLGTMRTGPDLANIGFRQSDEEWHFLHLYQPELVSPGSTMPPHPFLFQEVTQESSDLMEQSNACRLPGKRKNGQVKWIVPSKRAIELVEYLKRLKQEHDLKVVR